MSKGIKRLADNLIRYPGPVRTADNLVLDQTFLTANLGTVNFNVYDEGKEHFVAPATTRLRSDISAGSATWLIPKLVPLWVQVGDTLEITDDDGFTASATTADVDDVNLNFVTLTMTSGPISAASAGSQIRLLTKSSGGTILPLVPKAGSRKLTVTPHNPSLELVSNVPSIVTVAPTAYNTTKSTEDGTPAVDQEEFLVATVPALGAPCGINGRVRSKIKSIVSMSEYGGQTPAVFADWTSTDPTKTGGGFQGILSDSLLGIEAGQMLRIEINFNADPAANMKDVASFLAPVIEG